MSQRIEGNKISESSQEQEKSPSTIALAEQYVVSQMQWMGDGLPLARSLVADMPARFISDLGVLSIAAANVTRISGKQIHAARENYWEATIAAFGDNLINDPENLVLRAMMIVNKATAGTSEAFVRLYDYTDDKNLESIARELGLIQDDMPLNDKHVTAIYSMFENMVRTNILQHLPYDEDKYTRYRLNPNVETAFGGIVTSIYEGEIDTAAESYSRRFFIHTTES